MHVTAIIAAGGRGSRVGSQEPKQLLAVAGRSILQRSVDAFVLHPRISDVIVALPADLASAPPSYLRHHSIRVVEGGERRRDSVARAFAHVAAFSAIVVIHDAARPFVSGALIERTIDAASEHGAAIAAMPVTDTVKRGDAERRITATLPRSEIYLAQTPQAFRREVLAAALAGASAVVDATDEAMLAEQAGYRVQLVDGESSNIKITNPADLDLAARLASPAAGPDVMRVGIGYDLHVLVAGRPLVLGGVTIPFEKGLQGHSDADAVCHAVTDAVLGATATGDIGRHFPDTDAEWQDADSIGLLRRAGEIAGAAGYRIGNVDVVVIAQRPKLSPYADAMRENLASALGIDARCVSVKGKTNEGVDSMGVGASIAVHAVVSVIGPGLK